MVAIKLETFGGMIPAVDAVLLPNTNSQVSQNGWLYDGKLRAFRVPRLVHALINPVARTVYRIPQAGNLAVNIPSSIWMEFAGLNVTVVRTPNRNTTDPTYYYAGDTPLVAPRYNSQSRLLLGQLDLVLGVVPPASALTVAPSGGASAITEARSYTHTYVTVFGEEGPPSTPTAVTTGKIDDNWVVTLPAVVADRGDATKAITAITQATTAQLTVAAHGYTLGATVWIAAVVGMVQINNLYARITQIVDANNFKVAIDSTAFTAYASGGTVQRVERQLTKVRIYRTITSAQGVATFFFVSEQPIQTTSYTDTVTSAVIANNAQLVSSFWIPPPTGLLGFVAMPNGILIGWVGNQIWFSEPYQPHAWPASYQLNTDFAIVGIGVVGQTAVICTEGSPYACTGNDPAAMVLARVSAVQQPCVSPGSIVSTPQGVYYGASTGLVAVSAGGQSVATDGLFSQADWQGYVTLARLSAAILNGAYFFFSGQGDGCFEPTAFENTAFLMLDFTGTKTGGVIDFHDKRIAFSQLTSTDPTYNVIQDDWSAEVLIIRGTSVYQIDMTNTSLEGSYTWKSKKYQMDYPTNLGSAVVYHTLPVNQPSAATTLNVYADGNLLHTRSLPASGTEFRLPAGQLYDYYEFEFVGNLELRNAVFATTAKELRNA